MLQRCSAPDSVHLGYVVNLQELLERSVLLLSVALFRDFFLVFLSAFPVGEGVWNRVLRALTCGNQRALSADERQGFVRDSVCPQRRHYGPCWYLHHPVQSGHCPRSHGTTETLTIKRQNYVDTEY